MIGEERAPSISSGPVIVTDNPVEKTLAVFSFLWVHNSSQAECTRERPTIFPACHLYKVLTPMRLWRFTLQEFFIRNREGGLISELAGISSCVDWLNSKHSRDASQTCSEWRGSDSVLDALGGGRKCSTLLMSSKWKVMLQCIFIIWIRWSKLLHY